MSSAWSTSLAATILSHRRRRGLSQGALATEAQIPKSAVIALEGGDYNPTMSTIENIAIALMIPVTSLLVPVAETTARRIPCPAPVAGDPLVERLGQYPAGLAWEFWRMKLPPHDAMQGPPASPGAVRLIHIQGGVLHAGPESSQERLHPGESMEFAGDDGHVYSTGAEGADVFIALGRPTHLMFHARH